MVLEITQTTIYYANGRISGERWSRLWLLPALAAEMLARICGADPREAWMNWGGAGFCRGRTEPIRHTSDPSTWYEMETWWVRPWNLPLRFINKMPLRDLEDVYVGDGKPEDDWVYYMRSYLVAPPQEGE